MSVDRLTFDELVYLAQRTGVHNWQGPDANGVPVSGRVIAAPSSHRGEHGSMGTIVGCTRHHTGTDETFLYASDYPTYGVVKEGRTGLNNSLSAYGLGRWYGIYVFSEFISWHAGTWMFQGIVDGNGHFLGIEAEGTGARWTPFQREFYPRLCGSILSYIGEDIDMMPRHADGAMPRGRKSDAANLWASFTDQVAGYIRDPATITYGGTPVPAPEPEQEDDEMIIAIIRTASGGYVPHAIAGDRYFAIDNDMVRGLKSAGVKSAEFNEEAHKRFVSALGSEKAVVDLGSTPTA